MRQNSKSALFARDIVERVDSTQEDAEHVDAHDAARDGWRSQQVFEAGEKTERQNIHNRKGDIDYDKSLYRAEEQAEQTVDRA